MYDWADKYDVCHRLFVDEKMSLQAIRRFFVDKFGADGMKIPSPSAFRKQFDKWAFGRKSRRLREPDDTLVARVKQLWEGSILAIEMLPILRCEGFDINGRKLDRLRKKHGFMLKTGQAFGHASGQGLSRHNGRPSKATTTDNSDSPDNDDDPPAVPAQQMAVQAQQIGQWESAPAFTPQEMARRQEMQAESDRRFVTKKRRRRTRGYSHMPADPAGLPPRFVSETSFDECKAILCLSNDSYLCIREQFLAICLEMDIVKKTIAGPETWQAAKDQLIRENAHLSAMLHPLQTDLERRSLSLDLICMDVTKKVRNNVGRILVPQAKVALGFNPAKANEVRATFYQLLVNDNYTSRLTCGEDRWDELQRRWIDNDEEMKAIAVENDPHKMKCLDILSRDAMKRFREDRTKARRAADPSLPPRRSLGPGPGPATNNKFTHAKRVAALPRRNAAAALTMQHSAPTVRVPPPRPAPAAGPSDLEIDPSLLLAANASSSWLATAPGPTNHPMPDAPFQPDSTTSHTYPLNPPEPTEPPIPAYFRLNPATRLVGNHPKMWLGSIASPPTMSALHEAASARAGAATITKLQGLVKESDGTQTLYQIDDQDELEVYLDAAGEKATFILLLEGGYA